MDWLDAPRPSNTFSFSEDASFLTEKRRFCFPSIFVLCPSWFHRERCLVSRDNWMTVARVFRQYIVMKVTKNLTEIPPLCVQA